jgi:hypothetical protein
MGLFMGLSKKDSNLIKNDQSIIYLREETISFYKQKLKELRNTQYGFKVFALYELAIRNQDNQILIQDIVDTYYNNLVEINFFMQEFLNNPQSEVENEYYAEKEYYTDSDATIYLNGRKYYNKIEANLRELGLFAWQEYFEDDMIVYARSEIFSRKIFTVINNLYNLYNLYNEIHYNRVIPYKLTKIEGIQDSTTTISIYFDNLKEPTNKFARDQIIINYVKKVDAYTDYIEEIQTNVYNYFEAKALYDSIVQNPTYDNFCKLIPINSCSTTLRTIQLSSGKFLPVILRTIHKVDLSVSSDFLLSYMKSDEINKKNFDHLFTNESVFLDSFKSQKKVHEPKSAFRYLANLLKKPQQFFLDVLTYDSIEAYKRTLHAHVKTDRVPKGEYEAIQKGLKNKIPDLNKKVSVKKFSKSPEDSISKYKIKKSAENTAKRLQNINSDMKTIIKEKYYMSFQYI